MPNQTDEQLRPLINDLFLKSAAVRNATDDLSTETNEGVRALKARAYSLGCSTESLLMTMWDLLGKGGQNELEAVALILPVTQKAHSISHTHYTVYQAGCVAWRKPAVLSGSQFDELLVELTEAHRVLVQQLADSRRRIESLREPLRTIASLVNVAFAGRVSAVHDDLQVARGCQTKLNRYPKYAATTQGTRAGYLESAGDEAEVATMFVPVLNSPGQ